MALVENIQREDLDPIEIAISFQRLIEECNLTHDALSQNVGKNRTTITNYLRLLKLPAEIQIGLRKSTITMGHARALININDPKVQLKLFNDIIKHDLSVRKVETLVRDIDKITPFPKDNKKQPEASKYEEISRNLGDMLNAKVGVKRNNNGRGSIVINFISDDDLKRIMDFFSK
jgi:ParB family chromosome partitioning protein